MNQSKVPRFLSTDLTAEQRDMISLLGKPAIIGSAGTAAYLVDDAEREGVQSIAPRHTISYLCPIVMVLGKPRQVMPNGDLREVDPDTIGPPQINWVKGL